MLTHPFLTQQLVDDRRQDLLASARASEPRRFHPPRPSRPPSPPGPAGVSPVRDEAPVTTATSPSSRLVFVMERGDPARRSTVPCRARDTCAMALTVASFQYG